MIKRSEETPISIANEIGKQYDFQLKVEMLKNGVRSSFRHLLTQLAKKDGVTQLDLVKATNMKAPTVSTTLRSMEAEGLVVRETDKNDARATRVFLTARGRNIDSKMRVSAGRIDKMFLEVLTESEQEQLTQLLSKMRNNMSRNMDSTAWIMVNADDQMSLSD